MHIFPYLSLLALNNLEYLYIYYIGQEKVLPFYPQNS